MGRPKGSKNKSTLLKEASIERILRSSQDYLIAETPRVLKAMVEKAINGDIGAAKLILDRTIPARRSIDEMPNTKMAIQINITPSEVQHRSLSYEDSGSSEEDLEPQPGTERGAGSGAQGPEVIAFRRGPEGKQ